MSTKQKGKLLNAKSRREKEDEEKEKKKMEL